MSWKREGEQLAAQLAQMKTKDYSGMDALQKRFDAWEATCEKHDWDESRKSLTGKYASVRASGGDVGSGPRDGVLPMGATGRAKDVAFLAIAKKDARDAYEAVKRGQNYIIQAKDAATSFSTVDSLLVAQQAPGIVPEYFDARLIDHLPVIAISAPPYSSSSTNTRMTVAGLDLQLRAHRAAVGDHALQLPGPAPVADMRCLRGHDLRPCVGA